MKTSNPLIYAVIPVFETVEQTRLCLDALNDSHHQNIKIIIVDHGPSDNIQNLLLTHYPHVIHLKGHSDMWWSAASNLGIQYAIDQGAELIMLLNNDCYISPNTVDILLSHHQALPEAVIAPVQMDYETKAVETIALDECMVLGFAGLSISREISAEMKAKKIIPARMIGGGRGVIIPRYVFDQIGLFDEKNLPHYYADNDFYLNCRDANIPLMVAIDAEVYIDSTHTSIAVRPEQLTLTEFLASLSNIKSHRNLKALKALFKKHYPIKGLYMIGLFLNIIRYSSVYALKRLKYKLSAQS